MSAETVAATRKADESILLQIADKDMVALEVKFHKRCYEKYTSLKTACSQLKRKMKSKSRNTKSHLMFSVKTLLLKGFLNRIIYITF